MRNAFTNSFVKLRPERHLQHGRMDIFYQFLPNKIYQIKSEKSSGETLSKIRITSMAATNAIDEEKSPTLGVVTKFQKNVALTIDTFR